VEVRGRMFVAVNLNSKSSDHCNELTLLDEAERTVTFFDSAVAMKQTVEIFGPIIEREQLIRRNQVEEWRSPKGINWRAVAHSV